jgi:hypothetical protein
MRSFSDIGQDDVESQREVIGAVSKSQTPITEIVTPHLPLDLEGCRKIGEPKPIRLLSKEEIATLHNCIRKSDANDVREEDFLLADDLETSPPAVLLMAVNPSSGDSLFHAAMRAQRIDVLSQLRETFPPNNVFAIGSKALFRHTNHHGETMLHAATQTGNLDMVIAAYRLFGRDHALARETPYARQVPIEEVNTPPHEGIPHVAFLLSENSRGQTAAEWHALLDSMGFLLGFMPCWKDWTRLASGIVLRSGRSGTALLRSTINTNTVRCTWTMTSWSEENASAFVSEKH